MDKVDEILTAKNLCVRFGSKLAVHIIDKIIIKEGDIIGVIGENGAGKTTFINALLNKIPYEGEIERNFKMENLGIMLQNNSYNGLMKTYELIQIVSGQIKFDKSLQMLLNEFGIQEYLNTKIKNLSGGEKQRLTLALMLYLKPEILIFDEMTTGLDFQKRQQLQKYVRNYTRDKTVINITHYFEELENWANKILILHHGELKFYGTLEELKEKHPYNICLKVKRSLNVKKSVDLPYKMIEYNDEYDGVLVPDNDLANIEKKLWDNKISYDKSFIDLYILYRLELGEGD